MPSDKLNRFYTNNTANDRPTRTVPHTSHSDHTQNQQQTSTQKNTRLRKYDYGRKLNTSQTKITQTTPTQKKVDEDKHAQHSM